MESNQRSPWTRLPVPSQRHADVREPQRPSGPDRRLDQSLILGISSGHWRFDIRNMQHVMSVTRLRSAHYVPRRLHSIRRPDLIRVLWGNFHKCASATSYKCVFVLLFFFFSPPQRLTHFRDSDAILIALGVPCSLYSDDAVQQTGPRLKHRRLLAADT